MLRQEYLEQEIKDLQKKAEKLGLHITEFLVEDHRVITELEKRRIGLLRMRLRPAFVSPKNYKRLRLKDNEIGYLFVIRFFGGHRELHKKQTSQK